MKRRILVLFPDEWDHAVAADPRYRDRFEFHLEGFDLFSFPDNARLFTFDALKFVERMVERFADVMRAHSSFTEDPFSMIAEGALRGRQVTANGYARDGRVTMLGTVDSLMYPGTDQFQRFQYPSSLPAAELARVDELAARVVSGIGLAHGMFNVEMRLDPATQALSVIEINPRAAGQFYDVCERVDGYRLFDALLALECGEEPVTRKRAGRERHAASFVLRDLSGEGLSPLTCSAG